MTFQQSIVDYENALPACSLPRVRPHYAVKCNPNGAIIAMLAAVGASFDCASQQVLI